MNKVKANYYMCFRYSKSIYILGVLSILMVLITFIFAAVPLRGQGSDNFSVTYVGMIFIAMMIYLTSFSITSTKATISYSIRMGSTRTDYFLGSTAYYITVAALLSIIHTLLLALEGVMFRIWGIKQLNNFSFIYDKLDFIASVRLTIYCFLIFTTIISVVTMFSHLAHIIGQRGWLIIFAGITIGVFIVIPISIGYFVEIIPEGITRTGFNVDKVNMIDFIITISAFLLSYLIIDKIQLRDM